MTPDTEVVVVGGGVMGLATTWALAAAGHDVVALEQLELGHDRGSSHGSSRIFRLSYPEEAWVRLAQEALPLWRRLEATAGQTLLEQHGSLDLGDWEPNRRALRAAGVAAEVLDAATLRRRFPIRVDAGESGLLQSDGGIVHAERAQRALAAAAAAAGGRLVERARVTRLELNGGCVRAEGPAHAVTARAAVVTCGGWARGVLAPLGIELPVRVTRETVTYHSLEGAESLPSVIDTTAGGAPGYALAAPGAGLKAGLHRAGAEADPDERGEPDRQLVARTHEWLARRIPAAVPTGRAETCLYTNTSDERFVLERRGRLVVGSACSGHGFKFAPLVGRRLAALAAEALEPDV